MTFSNPTLVSPPFAHSYGSPGAKLAIIGEAWGKNEEDHGRPLCGESGMEFAKMLCEAGLVLEPPPLRTSQKNYLRSRELMDWWDRTGFFVSNTFAFRPTDNKLEYICAKRKEVGKDYLLPPIKSGQYVKPEYLGELARLKTELEIVKPNLILALGNIACWAILRMTNIGSIRGAVTTSGVPYGIKTLPTYHPAAILRQWSWRPIVLADLLKAKREMETPDIIRPQRWVTINPTLTEISNWMKIPSQVLSVDIETVGGQIRCVGFARSIQDALVIPFVDFSKKNKSYWERDEDEIQARRFAQQLLASPIPKIFQNGLFDLQYLLKEGFRPANCLEDTMLLHHSMFPEMKKGLGFMGSIYTNEQSWKLMRKRGEDEELKRDD